MSGKNDSKRNSVGTPTNNAKGLQKPNQTPDAVKNAQKVSLAQLSEKINLQDEEIRSLRGFTEAQATHIVQIEENYAALKKRVEKLEHDSIFNESLSIIKDRVIVELKEEVNRIQQFMRRPCVSIVGLPKSKGEKMDDLKNSIQKMLEKTDGQVQYSDVDKFHRDGPRFGATQDVIVRFQSHAAKEAFYKKRKDIAGDNQRLKIRPSLTTGTKKLLDEASAAVNEFKRLTNPPEFVLPDVHGNLLIKMKKESDIGLFVPFRNMETFVQKVYLAQGIEETEDEFRSYDLSSSDEDDGRGLFA